MNDPIACVAPLFLPANRLDRLAKAYASGADALILDLEDAVAPGEKTSARAVLAGFRPEMPIFVRVNSAGTAWHDDDVRTAHTLSLAGIILPKAETGPALKALAAGPLPVLALVETARGLAEARAIAQTHGVARLIFGSVDYAADLGLSHEREVLMAARAELVLASRLAGIAPPIDGVTLALTDEAALQGDIDHARCMGFTGKLAIHPKQVATILRGFLPNADEIDWARRVLAAGDGVTVIDGKMVDEPLRIAASRIMARATREA